MIERNAGMREIDREIQRKRTSVWGKQGKKEGDREIQKKDSEKKSERERATRENKERKRVKGR